MPTSPWWSIGRVFFRRLLLVSAALYLILGSGQFIQLIKLVGGLREVDRLFELSLLASVILAEIVLPLGCLVAVLITLSQQRSEGAIRGLASLGYRPSSLLIPVTAPVVLASMLAVLSAHFVTPRAVQRVAEIVRSSSFSEVAEAIAPGEGITILREDGSSDGPWWMLMSQINAPAVIGTADRIELSTDGEPTLRIERFHLWHGDQHVSVDQAVITLDHTSPGRTMGMLGPPNSLSSSSLDMAIAHHQFVWHRRFALPLIVVPWTIFAGVLAILFGGVIAGAGVVTMVASGYGILRLGELSARAGDFSPALAAWVPVLLASVFAGVALVYVDRTGGRFLSN